MNAPPAHFALGRFLLLHRDKLKFRRYRQNENLQHRLSGTEDVRLPLLRRLEYDERDHRPPFGAQKCWHRDWYGACGIGIEARVRFGAYGEVLADFQVEQELGGVVILS